MYLKQLFTIGLVLVAVAVFGQQELQQTQFMYFKQGFNPAAVGTNPDLNLFALYRGQWLGLEGAPQQQVLGLSGALADQKLGLGVNIRRRALGLTESLLLETMYAYHVKTDRARISFGLQGSVESTLEEYTRATSFEPGQDAAIPGGNEQMTALNFGAGFMVNFKENLFVGGSIPRLIDRQSSLSGESIAQRHVYLTGGVKFDLSANVQGITQTMIRYYPDDAPSVDLNALAIYNDLLIGGITYRTGGDDQSVGESVALLLGAKVAKDWMIVGSYDYTLSQIADYSQGTVEVVLSYRIHPEGEEEYLNPRFF